MLHFAYGSNMSRTLMRLRCPDAQALGVATLAGWRFIINPEGLGSLAPQQGSLVHGVLWRLTARDLAAVNAYESVDSGLYLRRRLAVRCGGAQAAALVYIARRDGEGRPRPGHLSTISSRSPPDPIRPGAVGARRCRWKAAYPCPIGRPARSSERSPPASSPPPHSSW